ncbi:flagellar motor switch protein FliG [Tropicimonas sp. IMCC34043]|uniref:flagellar motor switch protein FliG n=1 Tax=Tropicimonas sp. IMCC34043 TaxID=2248760 RepID=UPI001E3BF43A|nr:FliG C-terminal domain-containing protein [Tropicimonas sp. IMCC34043]
MSTSLTHASSALPPTRTEPPRPATVAPAAPGRPPKLLSRRQKAAVIVQLLLKEGDALPLGELPEAAQEALTNTIGDMRIVDRGTLLAVVAEFVDEMEDIGLTFPGDIEGALGLLDGHINASTAARLRREAGVAARGDPWLRIAGLPTERLLQVLEEESTEVGAVMLSKLSVSQSAQLLERLPGNRARQLSYAISRTGRVSPETVRRVGLSLAAQLDAEPILAFDTAPVERVGAILNFSRSTTRDEVLAGLDETDAEFAAEVRRTIFTFEHIPIRILPRDVPRIIRGIDQAVLVTALAHAGRNPALEPARDHILLNISKRMADTLREEIDERDRISDAEGEDATTAIVAEIRRLVDAGELVLTAEDPEAG